MERRGARPSQAVLNVVAGLLEMGYDVDLHIDGIPPWPDGTITVSAGRHSVTIGWSVIDSGPDSAVEELMLSVKSMEDCCGNTRDFIPPPPLPRHGLLERLVGAIWPRT